MYGAQTRVGAIDRAPTGHATRPVHDCDETLVCGWVA